MASTAGGEDLKVVKNPDEAFKADPETDRDVQQRRPWAADTHYFTKVKVSALALIKMAMHCRSGGEDEVMGMMQGRIVPYHDSSENKEKGIFMVLDAFALPVEGTETRVNAQEEAYEYMVEYKQRQDEIGREENVVGWYHSHPGYGCWLSGIDVQTQRTNQTYQEPFVAIVVDPVRTVAAGKVELGAFRTLPQGNRERACSDIPGKSKSKQTSSEEVPLHKVEDFGVHAEEYYSLPVECFRTELDGRLFHLLWREYWAGALAGTSEARFMRTQVTDVASKLEKAVQQTSGSRAVDAARGGARAAVERSKGAAARAAAAEALGGGGW